MKLLTFYSETHKKMYEDYFLDSYKEYLKDELDIIPLEIEQLSKDGSFGSVGFEETMIHKLEHIINNIDLSEDYLIYADCDIHFFSPIVDDLIKELGDYDIKFQDDKVCLCAGFFICKQTEEVKNFFIKVLNILKGYMINGKLRSNISDQIIINQIYNREHINIGKLPSDKYFTVAHANGGKQWKGEDFIIPDNIKVHHSNWTVGVDRKIEMMEYIRNNKNG
jgi:hypothetical protein